MSEESLMSCAKVLAMRDEDYWGEYPEYSVESWQHEVANGDTRSGYWEWVASQVENDGYFAEEADEDEEEDE